MNPGLYIGVGKGIGLLIVGLWSWLNKKKGAKLAPLLPQIEFYPKEWISNLK